MKTNLIAILDSCFTSRKEVLFIVPPFSSIDMPNIGVHILKEISKFEKVGVNVFYGNIFFAKYIKKTRYQLLINNLRSLYQQIGERIFAKAAFGDKIPKLGFNANLLEEYFKSQNNISDISWKDLNEISDLAEEWIDIISHWIAKENYKMIGIAVGHQQTNAAIALVNQIKALNRDIITIVAGSGCDGEMGAGVLDLSDRIDYVFSGESEESWKKFLVDFKKKTHLSRKGLIEGRFVKDLDTIPKPNYIDFYHQLDLAGFNKEKVWLLYESSRHCWWGVNRKCNFCGVNGGKETYRHKKSKKVLEELVSLSSLHPSNRIMMVDTLMPREYLKTVLPVLRKIKPHLMLFYEQRADLNISQMIALKKSGIISTQVGIEALSSSLLKLMNKGISLERNIRFLRYARAVGCMIQWNMLTDIPNDNCEDWEIVKKIVPLIFHLNPPSGLRKLEIARFSPYYSRASDFSISNVEPLSVYNDIFPKIADKRKLAWLFSATYKSYSKTDLRLQDFLNTIIGEWISTWNLGRKGLPKLEIIKENDRYFLHDTRPNIAIDKKEEISKEQALVALVKLDFANLDNFIKRWATEKKLVIEVDTGYIPLATANPYLIEELENEFEK